MKKQEEFGRKRKKQEETKMCGMVPKNLRHGAGNMQHGAKNVHNGATNVRHGAKKSEAWCQKCARLCKNVRHGAKKF